MAMIEENAAARLEEEYASLITPGNGRTNNTFIDILNIVIDEEFQNAEPTVPNIDITTVAGTLDIQRNIPSKMAYEIAYACCEYWSMAVETSGESVSVLGISEIVNDAMDYVTPMEQEILAINNGENQAPNFLNLMVVILSIAV